MEFPTFELAIRITSALEKSPSCPKIVMVPTVYVSMRGREGGREDGMEGGWDGGREDEREGGTMGGWDGMGWREGGWDGGKERMWEEEREEGRKG